MCLMDEGRVSQKLMQKILVTFFFLDTHEEMHSLQAYDYTNQLYTEYSKVIKNATNIYRIHKNKMEDYLELFIFHRLPF